MNNNNHLKAAKKAVKQSSDNKGPKAYPNEGFINNSSDAVPKDTGRLNIQSTGNDFYTGISNDDMSSISSINSCSNDSITHPQINKSTIKK